MTPEGQNQHEVLANVYWPANKYNVIIFWKLFNDTVLFCRNILKLNLTNNTNM